MMGWPKKKADCQHRTAADFTSPLRDDDGNLIWICSNCERKGAWTDDWGYYGNLECRSCGRAVIEFAACCDGCEEELRKKRGDK